MYEIYTMAKYTIVLGNRKIECSSLNSAIREWEYIKERIYNPDTDVMEILYNGLPFREYCFDFVYDIGIFNDDDNFTAYLVNGKDIYIHSKFFLEYSKIQDMSSQDLLFETPKLFFKKLNSFLKTQGHI